MTGEGPSGRSTLRDIAIMFQPLLPLNERPHFVVVVVLACSQGVCQVIRELSARLSSAVCMQRLENMVLHIDSSR